MVDEEQPVDDSVNVIGAVPSAIPVTIPDETPTVAIDGAPLLHEPEPEPSVNVIVEPRHTSERPEGGTGTGSTFTVTTAAQPDDMV